MLSCTLVGGVLERSDDSLSDGGRNWTGTFGEGACGSSSGGDGGLDLDRFLDLDDNILVRLFCFSKGFPTVFVVPCGLINDRLSSSTRPMILPSFYRTRQRLSKTMVVQQPSNGLPIATG